MKYRICNTLDPEERLEDAAMAKAMHDAFAPDLTIVSEGAADFGRDLMFQGPGRRNIAYWRDPAFIRAAGREVWLLDAEGAEAKVKELHLGGKSAFVKATDLKLFAMPIPVGTSFSDALCAYIWSVIDRPPCILVQPFCQIEYEVRFVSVGRKIVTHSPCAWHLTPISRLPVGDLYRKNGDAHAEIKSVTYIALIKLARSVAKDCQYENVIIDCGMIDGQPGVIEFNPFSIGNFGLYACDPKAIADAYAKQVRGE